MLIWRSSFTKVGAFSEDAERHDFLDWYAKAVGTGLQSTVIPDVLAMRRIHNRNWGRQNEARKQSSFLHTLRAALNKRRQHSLNEVAKA
jgi:hypothetical protein